ncbi:MAG TPA: cytochrome c [Terriglobales bacterium]|nr:cytochrome c [Terriglobales bacterium]
MIRHYFSPSKSAIFVLSFALIFASTGLYSAHAQAKKEAAEKGKPVAGGDLARGKYLVEGVAMCGQCHTPRDSEGNLDRSRWLQGAPVPWAPANAGAMGWPMIAPRIGGNPPASDADMVKLLTTGIWTNGKTLHFPMMPFRMNEGDAKAVVAYLKTVK